MPRATVLGSHSAPSSPPAPCRVKTRVLARLLALLAIGVVLRVPTFGRPLLSDDEAIYAVTADALARGGLLYRDVVDHKPPLIYYVYRLGFAACGGNDMRGTHALVVLAVLATAALLFAIKRREEPIHAASASLAAAGLFLVFSTTWHDYDALAANGELFLLVPQSLAAWVLLRDLHRRSHGARAAASHLVVGALIGTSALFKYQGLTFLGASLGLLGWWVMIGHERWPWAARRAMGHLIGAGVPPALYLSWCAASGNAGAAIDWFAFNFSYLHAGLTGAAAVARGLRRTALIGGVALVPYGLGGLAAFAAASSVLPRDRRAVARSACGRRRAVSLGRAGAALARDLDGRLGQRRTLLRTLLPLDPGSALPAGSAGLLPSVDPEPIVSGKSSCPVCSSRDSLLRVGHNRQAGRRTLG